MAPPVGPTGIRYCSGHTDEEDEPPPWRFGTSYSFASTRIDFDLDDDGAFDDGVADFHKHSAVASLERRLFERLSLQLTLGAVLDGELELNDRAHDVDPGWLATLAATYRILDPDGAVPFILLSASFGSSRTTTTEIGVSGAPRTALWSFDGRGGLAVGWSIANAVNPYAAARGFGLPVLWTLDGQDATGTDHFHYQVGAGVLVTLPASFDVFVEGTPLGEKTVSAGVGYAF